MFKVESDEEEEASNSEGEEDDEDDDDEASDEESNSAAKAKKTYDKMLEAKFLEFLKTPEGIAAAEVGALLCTRRRIHFRRKLLIFPESVYFLCRQNWKE